MAKAKRTIKARTAKKAVKQKGFVAIAMQPVAFVTATVAKITTLFK